MANGTTSGAARTASGGGNVLTKKLGPLPVWGWVAIAVVGYYLYTKSRGTAATSTTSPTGVAPSSTETVTYPGGESYTGPVGGAPPPPGNSGPSPGNGYTPPTGETLQGSGYYVPGSTSPIQGSDAYSYTWVSTPTQAHSLAQAGQTLYFQPVPGVFVPTKGVNLGPGTPQFVRAGGGNG